jgi:hypothetical protein
MLGAGRPMRRTTPTGYSPPQLPPTGPSILVHTFSFSSTPLFYHGVARRTPTASKTAPSRSVGHAPLLREAARAPVRGTRGAGASIRNRSPRPGARRRRELLLPVAKGAAGSGSSPVRLLPAVGCRPSLSVAPRGHRRRAPPAPQCPVGANHCAHVASVFLTCCKCSVRVFQN